MKIVKESDQNLGKEAKKILQNGGLISFPADTVYGIAADASSHEAVAKLYQVKNRNPKKPIAVFLKDIAQAKEIFYFDEKAEIIAKKFMPGPLTMILKLKPQAQNFFASNLNKNSDGFLGFRIVDRKAVKAIFSEFDGIMAVTSANKSNEKEALSYEEVANCFSQDDLDLIVESEDNIFGVVSTVIRIDGSNVEILRQGAISQTQILQL